MTKVLVVDDSTLMRKYLQDVLIAAGFEVETARNGRECLERIPQYRPQVITLDVNMPVMDGLTCLKSVMQHHPTPVIMVSSLTKQGATETFEALELGAVDYISKSEDRLPLTSKASSAKLIAKINSAAKINIDSARQLKSRLRMSREKRDTEGYCRKTNRPLHADANVELILIGVSTGGPSTLQEIISSLPASLPAPIVIAQHMPAKFTPVFAKRLDSLSSLTVSEVKQETVLRSNHVYLAKGDADIKVMRRGSNLIAQSVAASEKHLWHPNVDILVESATQAIQANRLLCVQLTGMGNDGATAMANAHQHGARTIAESQDTAIVFGMPRALIKMGAADMILPCHDIATAIINEVKPQERIFSS